MVEIQYYAQNEKSGYIENVAILRGDSSKIHITCAQFVQMKIDEKNVEDKLHIKVKADVILDCVDNFCYLGDEIVTRGSGGSV